MKLELHLYDANAGFDDAGVPVEVTRTVTLDLPPAQPGRFAWSNTEARCQAFADLLAALTDEGEPS